MDSLRNNSLTPSEGDLSETQPCAPKETPSDTDEAFFKDLDSTTRSDLDQTGQDYRRLANGLRVPEETLERFQALNESYAFVVYGGKTRYIAFVKAPGLFELPYQFMDQSSFNGLLNNKDHAELQKLTQTGWESTYMPLTKAWGLWPGRRTYSRVGFMPGRNEVSDDTFNIWEGWRVKPVPGSWKKLRRHIWEVICRCDRRKYKWMLNWMAYLVQTTGDTRKRSPVSPIVWGKKGSGKSIVLDYLVKLFGNHGMTISKNEHLTGKFNKHLMQSVFVIAEEAVYARDPKSEGPLKDLLTRKSITIEPKGVDAFECPNYCRFAFVSNEKLSVPMSQDERRYQPFEASSHRIGDTEWFEGIVEEMDNGGLEAMFHDLQTRKYNASLIRRTISGSADLDAMKAEAAGPVETFLVEWIADGCIKLPVLGDAPERWTGEIPDLNRCCELKEISEHYPIATVKRAYDAWCKENLDRWASAKSARTATHLSTELGKLFPSIVRKRKSGARGILMPSLSECRQWISEQGPLGLLYREAIADDGDEE